MLAQCGGIPQVLGTDTTQDRTGLFHQPIEVRIRMDAERLKPLEELLQMGHGRVAEHLGLAIDSPGQSVGQVRYESRQFTGEGFFRQTNCLVKPGRDPLSLLFIEFRD